MNRWIRRASEFVVSEEGPTATEYAIMLALIIVVAIGTIRTLGLSLRDTFQWVGSELFG